VSRRQSRSAEVSDLADLESRLGHKFSNAEIARQALTHRSFGTPHNERLEFLGDALLNCAIATLLYERFTHLPEGDLSRLRAALVNQASLSQVAEGLGLGDRLRLGASGQPHGPGDSSGYHAPPHLRDHAAVPKSTPMTNYVQPARERVDLHQQQGRAPGAGPFRAPTGKCSN